ncbi:MAG: hypothetical protein P4K86_09830 [Terracidiphilus sp.]|nr:hypothetical protein [Terracidiphilus sp.]
MNTHPYLRAYLAGIFVPALVLPLVLVGFIVVRIVMQEPVPIEQALVFPMAIVPMLWGLWNMIFVWSRQHTHLPIGLHGTLLPILMAPVGAYVASHLGVLALGSSGITAFQACTIPYALIVCAFLAVLAGYYLIWKYVVDFVNRVLGIA